MAGSAFWVGLYCSSHRMMAQKTSVSMAIRPAHPHDETLGSCLLCRLVVKRSHCQAGSAPQPAAAGGNGISCQHGTAAQGKAGCCFLSRLGAWPAHGSRQNTEQLPSQNYQASPATEGRPPGVVKHCNGPGGVAGSLHKTAHR